MDEAATLVTTLLLIRHGHTEARDERGRLLMVGTTDVPLSARGHHEAELVALRLAAEHPRVRICTSPLRRATETASAIASRCGVDMTLVPELTEIHCGDADGLAIAEVQARYADAWERNLRQDDPDFRWPAGESYREFRLRCLRGVRAVAARGPGPHVLVTHAGVISQVVGALHGESPARWERFRPGNASITALRWTGDQGSMVRFDDQLHLSRGA